MEAARDLTDAEDLRIGDTLIDPDGKLVTVDDLRRYEKSDVVYNLTIEGVHTYYVEVSDEWVLVHNDGCRPPNLSPAGSGRSGAFNQAKRDSGVPTSQQPVEVTPNKTRQGNPQPGRIYKFEVPSPGGGKPREVIIRDDAGGHSFGVNNPQNRGRHFNAGDNGHYDY